MIKYELEEPQEEIEGELFGKYGSFATAPTCVLEPWLLFLITCGAVRFNLEECLYFECCHEAHSDGSSAPPAVAAGCA